MREHRSKCKNGNVRLVDHISHVVEGHDPDYMHGDSTWRGRSKPPIYLCNQMASVESKSVPLRRLEIRTCYARCATTAEMGLEEPDYGMRKTSDLLLFKARWGPQSVLVRFSLRSDPDASIDGVERVMTGQKRCPCVRDRPWAHNLHMLRFLDLLQGACPRLAR